MRALTRIYRLLASADSVEWGLLALALAVFPASMMLAWAALPPAFGNSL